MRRRGGQLGEVILIGQSASPFPVTLWCLGVYRLRNQGIERDFSWSACNQEHSCAGGCTILQEQPGIGPALRADFFPAPVERCIAPALAGWEGRSRPQSYRS